jgi:hypothetical protein
MTTALESAVPSLGFVPTSEHSGPLEARQAPIEDHEIIEDIDLAIVSCKGGPWSARQWFTGEAPLGTYVYVGGYPYSLDLEQLQLYVRAYRGHVVASRALFQLPGHPAGYELSFSAPRGLSGAPVFAAGDNPLVIGLIVQNARSGMLVHSDSERDTTTGKELLVERYEWLTFGVAVATRTIMDVHSRLVGGQISTHLARLNLLRS